MNIIWQFSIWFMHVIRLYYTHDTHMRKEKNTISNKITFSINFL